jgi:hypothetical protein
VKLAFLYAFSSKVSPSSTTSGMGPKSSRFLMVIGKDVQQIPDLGSLALVAGGNDKYPISFHNTSNLVGRNLNELTQNRVNIQQ